MTTTVKMKLAPHQIALTTICLLEMILVPILGMHNEAPAIVTLVLSLFTTACSTYACIEMRLANRTPIFMFAPIATNFVAVFVTLVWIPAQYYKMVGIGLMITLGLGMTVLAYIIKRESNKR